jgi:hypothetical protein
MPDNESTRPHHIFDAAYGFWRSKALFAAVEVDLFSILADGPLDGQTLTARTGIHKRAARDFFDALVALRVLDRDETDRYRNTKEGDRYLVRERPNYIGGLLKHLSARHYSNWNLLPRALATGEPQSTLGAGSYSGLYADGGARELFLEGMTAGSLLAAQALANAFPWSRYKTFIDIGAAEGCVPVEIARVHAHLSGGGFDLPAVKPTFEDYVRRQGMSGRLSFHPGDFFADPLPTADVLVMGRILHNWDPLVRAMLLKKAHQAIPEGGGLIIYDPLIDEERRQPHGLLSSLNMLIETRGGSEYTAAECRRWMAEAGFQNISIEPLADVHTAVFGYKRDAGR